MFAGCRGGYFATRPSRKLKGVVVVADTGRKWEIYQDKRGQWRWRVFASNGKLVGSSSQGYKDRGACVDNAKSFGYSG